MKKIRWDVSLLILSIIVLLICIFKFSYKVMAIGFIQFISVLIFCLRQNVLKNFSLREFIRFHDIQASNCFIQKKYIRGHVMYTVYPMCVIACVFVTSCLVVLLIV